MPLASVLLPVHNGARYLREAVESITSQDFADFELLIVNNASVDESASMIAELCERYAMVRSIEVAEKGICHALNAGLDSLGSKYILRMDADDIAVAGRIREQVSFMEANPSVVASGTWIEQFGAGARRLVRLPTSATAIRTNLLFRPCLAHPASILRTETLERNGIRYRAEYNLAEDYRLWSELSTVGALANLPRPLLRYRIHPGQTSEIARAAQQKVHVQISQENLLAFGISIEAPRLKAIMFPDESMSRREVAQIQGKLLLQLWRRGIHPFQLAPILYASIYRNLMRR